MALNFPDSPADGQVYDRYVWVESRGVWKALANSDYTLANLDDLNITSVSDGQGIVYDSSSSTWQNSDISVDVYDVTSSSTGFFDIPSGTTAERPASPTNGSIRFNTDLGEPEYYSEATGKWFLFRETSDPSFNIEYLVVAGGGGAHAGGGGAGGYRSSVAGESSGGNSVAENPYLYTDETINIAIGAGGSPINKGSNSSFGGIVSEGGGYGSSGASPGSGGSGGGAGTNSNGGTFFGGSATSGQGFDGGDASGTRIGAGGGGAGEEGVNGTSNALGFDGGDGISSSVDGSPTYRAGGGGGRGRDSGGTGGLGGGGDAGPQVGNGQSGQSNTGGGGGGRWDGTPGSGGSGVIILKYPLSKTLNAGPGLTHSTSLIGDYKVTTFTAGSDTITFS